MIVKRYYAPSMAEAMNTIRTELGPDAVILSTKPVRKKGLMGFFHKKQLEVIAAYEPKLESTKAREQREAVAYAAAAKGAGQGRERPEILSIPPAPGAAMGIPPVTAAGRAASAYKSGAGSTGARAQDARSVAVVGAPQRAAPSIQEALDAAIAAKEAAAREAAAKEEAARQAAAAQKEATAKQPAAESSIPSDRLDALEERLGAFAQAIDAMAARMGEGEIALSDEGTEIYRALRDGDVEEELARALAREAQDAKLRAGGSIIEATRRILLRELGDSRALSFSAGKRSVLLFVGPTGVGKTTTLVKLATMCAVRDGLKVGMINTDTYRIAAQEQLKIYADILGVPQSVVYAPGDIKDALGQMADREVIFVDTAGKRPGDSQHREDIALLLDQIGPDASVLLCVAAPTGPRALREVIDHYNFLGDYGMILTKTDEVAGAGAALNACFFSGKKLHYLTSGQSVPDDIEEADAQAIAARLLR